VELKSAFALPIGEHEIKYEFGEGLIGQVAASGKSIYLDEVPEGYKSIMSGLGMAVPKYLFITPIKKDNAVKAILEIATFSPIEDAGRITVDEMAKLLTEKI
jgi:methyl-accepting chemotaxis protein